METLLPGRDFSQILRAKSKGKKAGPAVGEDLLQRHFHARCPNVAWVVDITEHWTGSGKVYVCALKDLCSRRIVGWAVDGRMTSRLAVEALDDAMRKRHYPQGVIVHSDRGGQFRSRRFQAALKAYGARGSMGTVGACGDNAAMESFFALLQKNVLNRQSWAKREELSMAITR